MGADNEKSDIKKLIKMVMQKHFDPASEESNASGWNRSKISCNDIPVITNDCNKVTLPTPQIIVFSFSKKECESLAAQMVNLDLNNADEKAMIEEIYNG